MPFLAPVVGAIGTGIGSLFGAGAAGAAVAPELAGAIGASGAGAALAGPLAGAIGPVAAGTALAPELAGAGAGLFSQLGSLVKPAAALGSLGGGGGGQPAGSPSVNQLQIPGQDQSGELEDILGLLRSMLRGN